jgi:curved DNA-binding protein CbpA
MASPGDYYRVLGVSCDASTLEIRRAYRRLARQHHPDRSPEPDGAARFRTLAEAYAVLNHPVRRARYDRNTQPCVRRGTPRAPQAVFTHRGVLELSPREAQFAGTTPLTLSALNGLSIVLPAEVAEGDQVSIEIGHIRAVLTVRINST